MRFLAIERPVDGIAEAQFTREISENEARRAWELHQAGVIRELYFRDDKPAAVLMLECADEAEARSALATLPMVAAGLIAFEVIALRAYPGFGRLFAPSGWA